MVNGQFTSFVNFMEKKFTIHNSFINSIKSTIHISDIDKYH